MSSEHDHGKQSKPQLRLTGSIGEESAPDATDAPFLATRLGVLTHELAGLLDGSMRCLGMARRSLASTAQTPSGPNVEQQLQTVHAALERMAGLVHTAMQGSGSTIGSSAIPNDRAVTLGEAIDHAISVMKPLAGEHRIELAANVSKEAATFEAGPVYAVILNAIRNSVEAIISAGAGGKVEVTLVTSEEHPNTLELRVTDDGPGVSPACADGRAFIIGLTTKPGGNGIGLCLAAQIIGTLGGRITLRTDAPERADGRRGAVLEATWPAPEKPGSIG